MNINLPDISPEVACTLITIAGSVITVLISNRNAKNQAKSIASNEVEKMTRTWQREDKLSSDDEFKDLCEAIAAYLHDGTYGSQGVALVKIAGMRAKTSGDIAEILDYIYVSVRDGDQKATEAQMGGLLWAKRNPDKAAYNEPPKKRWFHKKES